MLTKGVYTYPFWIPAIAAITFDLFDYEVSRYKNTWYNDGWYFNATTALNPDTTYNDRIYNVEK